MRTRRWGRIVNVGSSSTRQPIPELNLSDVHRAAAVGFFKTLAAELAPDGITINTVATGMFATERLAGEDGSLDAAQQVASQTVPAGRLGNPAEYGDLVAFLCSERAAYLTGAVIPLDGGLVRAV
jgi:3-oxoacyl-[acyl-carrier protein] reductase